MPFYRPYQRPRFDQVYNMLFCEDATLYAPALAGGERWATLLASPPDPAALRRLAADAGAESRARLLAFEALRDAGEAVPAHEVLGVIMEVPQNDGLDVLAAYADGRVRYLHSSAKLTIVEDQTAPIDAQCAALMSAARKIVGSIGPRAGARPAPPEGEVSRLTILASDGAYFGQASFDALRADLLAGPAVAAAIAILQSVADLVAPEAAPE